MPLQSTEQDSGLTGLFIGEPLKIINFQETQTPEIYAMFNENVFSIPSTLCTTLMGNRIKKQLGI